MAGAAAGAVAGAAAGAHLRDRSLERSGQGSQGSGRVCPLDRSGEGWASLGPGVHRRTPRKLVSLDD